MLARSKSGRRSFLESFRRPADTHVTGDSFMGPPALLCLFHRCELLRLMSAFGTKRTWVRALHMSAFGGKADMHFCTANVRF